MPQPHLQSDAEILKPFLGIGEPPPAGGIGPICETCGQSRWVEIGGASAQDVYHPNIDIRAMAGVDIVHDLESGTLPFHDGHAERVKMIHCINHLSAVAAEKILEETYRLLQPGGSLYIMVTDVAFVCEQIAKTGMRECWGSCLWGTRGDTYEADFHYWGYTPNSLASLLAKKKFSRIAFRGWYNRWEFKMEAFK